MAIDDELIEEVRAEADIVQIVGEHVRLKRSGRTYRGPCPLHGGDGPNFSVDPDRGIFKCFVCNEGGDVFAFPMKLLGLDFLDAVRHVAERSGVQIPERGSRPEQDPYRHLREVLAFAEQWFREQLLNDEGGARARRYLLEERELPESAIDDYGVGWAPDSWRALREAAAVHEIGDDILIEAGLVKETERAREPFDLFRGRLIFPIYDLRARVVGFGGRLLSGSGPDDLPKYINSPDTPVFHKGSVIYGINWSRSAIRRAEVALVVEGYMDFISLAARGVENVVAPLGTGLTEQQARLLSRYTKRALLLYDSDQAGLRATFRSADELLRAGVHPSVATLPPSEDPDSIVWRGGAGALAQYTDAALDVLDRKIQILEQRDYLDSIEGRRRAVDALMPTVRAAADGALRDIYLSRVAEVTDVRRVTLERELRESTRAGHRRRPTARLSDKQPTQLGPERNLLLLLLRDLSLLPRVSELIEPEDFRVPDYREIYEALVELGRDGPIAHADGEGVDWLGGLAPAHAEQARRLLADPEELTHPEAVLDDAITLLRRRRLERRRDELKTEMVIAETPEKSEQLLSEIYDINRELSELGGRVAGWGLLKRDHR